MFGGGAKLLTAPQDSKKQCVCVCVCVCVYMYVCDNMIFWASIFHDIKFSLELCSFIFCTFPTLARVLIEVLLVSHVHQIC